MKKQKYKYYRVTANSMTSYELFLKVPEGLLDIYLGYDN